jgi:hypothetical protein
MLKTKSKTGQFSAARDQLAKLRNRFSEISRSDYFQCPQGLQLAARLARLGQAFYPDAGPGPKLIPADRADYLGKQWVTRPRPHVDRLACAWLIRRFIDPQAAIRYAFQTEPGEISFDMENSHFGHQGNWCSFEAMRLRFGLGDPALANLAEIVHEIDLRDGRYVRAEIAGIDAILDGWRRIGLSDAELEAHGLALFEGLYASFSSAMNIADKQDG